MPGIRVSGANQCLITSWGNLPYRFHRPEVRLHNKWQNKRRDALQISRLSARVGTHTHQTIPTIATCISQTQELKIKLILFTFRLKIEPEWTLRKHLHHPILLEVFRCHLLLVSFRVLSSLILVAPGSTFATRQPYVCFICYGRLTTRPALSLPFPQENENQCKLCAHLLVPSRLLTLKCRLWAPSVFANWLQIIPTPPHSTPPRNHMGSGTVYTQSELSVLDLHVCVFVKNNKTLDGES